ncbi:MAG TPA: response regulator transcription factor [Gaiellaceae bacterium]|nr:response regulator transcription factor [Gaiellaceae bacterium]
MSPRVLLVDDESDILEPVSYALQKEGFEVKPAEDGSTALELARAELFDVIVLDIMLPGISGMDVCRTLRAESDVPIIMLTARDSEVDRVLGLELGADDYVTKPFSSAELVSRIRAILRRRELDQAPSSGGSEVRVGGIIIDLGRHSVEVDGRSVDLTPSEFRLLLLLAEEPERVFTREQIMEHLWQTPYVGDTRACDAHISNLRRKLERDHRHPERIVTVREAGYKLVPV